jgi:phosphoadenosine phosphosulfate reductase
VWVTGLRRQQSKSRANLQAEETFTLPGGKVLSKLSPLADWTTRDVWYYAETHGIPLLPLYEKGYTSIGCAPCTSLPFDPDDPRSGRWSGQKLECGIHIQAS